MASGVAASAVSLSGAAGFVGAGVTVWGGGTASPGVEEVVRGAGRDAPCGGCAEREDADARWCCRTTNQQRLPAPITSRPTTTGTNIRRFAGFDGAGTAAIAFAAAVAFAAGTSTGIALPGAKPGNDGGGADGRRAGNSGDLNSGGSGTFGGADESSAATDFNLILTPVSALSSPVSRTGGLDPAGDPDSGGLAKGLRSISTFSPDIPGMPTAAELVADPTGGNPESEIASPAGSGSAGLIVIRGRNLTGAEPAGAAPAAGVLPGETGGTNTGGVSSRTGGRSSCVGSAAGGGDSVDIGGFTAEPLSVRSLSFMRDSGGGEGSSLIQRAV